jgi:tRNA threonylcarbamoyladenosine biosynthesis protein TsaB
MAILALDTATDRLAIGVRMPDGTTLERTVEGARRHAALLAPLVLEVLDAAGLAVSDLTGLALSDGPGSFTGLRVGAAFVKALARARDLPVWTASTLLVRAWGARPLWPDPPGALVGVGSARRGELYVAAYAEGRGPRAECRVLREPTVIATGASLPLSSPIAAIVGDVDPSELAPWPWARTASVVGPPEGMPRAAALLDLIEIAGGARQLANVAAWEPAYGRPAEAQAKWEREHGRRLVDPTGAL